MLEYACLLGFEDIVRLLLHYGADVNARGEIFSGPLMITLTQVYPINEDILNMLLAVGVDVCPPEENPLHEVWREDVPSRIVHTLLAAGAKGPIPVNEIFQADWASNDLKWKVFEKLQYRSCSSILF